MQLSCAVVKRGIASRKGTDHGELIGATAAEHVLLSARGM